MGHAEAVSHESDRVGSEREEKGLSGRFSGRVSPVTGVAGRSAKDAESLYWTWINEAARRIAPTGRVSIESVSLG